MKRYKIKREIFEEAILESAAKKNDRKCRPGKGKGVNGRTGRQNAKQYPCLSKLRQTQGEIILGKALKIKNKKIMFEVVNDRFSRDPYRATREEIIENIIECNESWQTDYEEDDFDIVIKNGKQCLVEISTGEIIAEEVIE